MTAELSAVRGQVEGLAEDLVQTALVKCWAAWGSIRNEDPTAYVRRTVMTTYFAWSRWRRSRPERLTDVDVDLVAVDDYTRVDNADLLEALRSLPKRMCAVVVLRYFEDLTEAQTAAALGCSVGTVKSQTHRAFRRLHLELSAAEEADR